MSDVILYGTDKLKAMMAVPAKDELAVIADRIRARIRQTTADIIATGNDLIAVQDRLEHGEFLAWIDREFGWTARSAQRFMLAAKFAEDKSDIVSYLPATTIYKLAAPSTSEEIKAEVVADLRAGRVVDHRQVEARISDERVHARHRAKLNARYHRKARSPAAQRRREREIARREGEAAARARAADAAAAECQAILEKLDPADLDRLRQVYEEFGPFTVLQRLRVQL
jgi:hypothetical protein